MPGSPTPPHGDIVFYQTEDGRTRVECRFADETLWLSQALIAELFQISVPTVNYHLKSIFEEAELTPEATIRRYLIVRQEGGREVAREIDHYNLDAGMWLDFAEDQARRRKQVFLKDWDARLDEFLRFNDRAVLPDKGKIKRAEADARAEAEYEEFAARRRAMLEAEGQRDRQETLEDAAKKLPGKRKRETPKEP